MASHDARRGAMSPVAFHILLSLADDDRHGLGIVDDVERRTQGAVILGPGTLYGSIKRLRNTGLIEEPSGRPAPDRDDPRRRYYRITEAGRRALHAEARHLERVVQVARDKAVLKRGRMSPDASGRSPDAG